jgi:hypothetical protein
MQLILSGRSRSGQKHTRRTIFHALASDIHDSLSSPLFVSADGPVYGGEWISQQWYAELVNYFLVFPSISYGG